MHTIQWVHQHLVPCLVYRAAGALPQTAEDTIGRNPCVRSSATTTITMLSSARFRAVVDTQSFLNFKFGLPLAHLKIEKYRISRPRPSDGSHLVLTECTPHRKSTHKMKNRSWIWRFPEVFCRHWSACGAPMPCGAGSSTLTINVPTFLPL